MAVPVTIADLSVTAASNSPAGADTVAAGTGPDDYLRAVSAIIRREQAQATAVASATTVDLGAIATGSYVHITGTTTITGFGTVAAGIERTVVFDAALTLTHNATSLILPGGANITTVSGDCAVLRSEGSGNWRCVSYEKASGAPVGSYQPLDSELTAIAGLASAANKVPRFTGSGTAEVIDVIYGEYTPTLTAGSNCASVQLTDGTTLNYIRIGTKVTVSGWVNIDPTLASTETIAYATIPIASNFTSVVDVAGSLNDIALNGYIKADTVNDRLQFTISSLDTNSHACAFVAVYTVK